jgi:ribosome biogenesis GTPase / thiamine phosphate phosphatase
MSNVTTPLGSLDISEFGFRAECFNVPPHQPGWVIARLIEHHRTGYLLAHAEGFTRAESHPKLKQLPPEERPAVGDFLHYQLGEQHFTNLLPRYAALKRAAAGERYTEQILAANIDKALIVCGLDRDFSARRIERYLSLVRGCGVDAAVILSKADAHPDPARALAQLRERLSNERIYALDTRKPEETLQLQAELPPGHTGVLLGSSGAGKSTLINTLGQSQLMATGHVRAGDGRGRHTTVHRALLRLPWGACLIDCPGLREIKLTADEAPELASFDDIYALATECRFRDCQHLQEPGCAVQNAIKAGLLLQDRVASFLKLHDERKTASARVAAKSMSRGHGPRTQRR